MRSLCAWPADQPEAGSRYYRVNPSHSANADAAASPAKTGSKRLKKARASIPLDQNQTENNRARHRVCGT